MISDLYRAEVDRVGKVQMGDVGERQVDGKEGDT